MKESRLLLAIFCVIGLGACVFAFKHGPLPLNASKNAVDAPPPGWTPSPAPMPVAPPVTPPSVTPPVTPPPVNPTPPQPKRNNPHQWRQPGPGCGPGG